MNLDYIEYKLKRIAKFFPGLIVSDIRKRTDNELYQFQLTWENSHHSTIKTFDIKSLNKEKLSTMFLSTIIDLSTMIVDHALLNSDEN